MEKRKAIPARPVPEGLPPPPPPPPPQTGQAAQAAPTPPPGPAAAPAPVAIGATPGEPAPPQVKGPTVQPKPPQQATGPDATPKPLSQVTGPAIPPAPGTSESAPAAEQAPAAAAPPEAPQAAEKRIREYRYRTRIIKAAILPVLFSVMSFYMLYSYVTGYEPYFTYDFDIIISGFAIGVVVTTGFLVANMRVARRDGTYETRQRNSVFIILAFLIPYLYLVILVSLSLAWKFSIGYFISAILSPFVVMAYEAAVGGKFYVQEEEVDNRLTRTLVFRA